MVEDTTNEISKSCRQIWAKGATTKENAMASTSQLPQQWHKMQSHK